MTFDDPRWRDLPSGNHCEAGIVRSIKLGYIHPKVGTYCAVGLGVLGKVAGPIARESLIAAPIVIEARLLLESVSDYTDPSPELAAIKNHRMTSLGDKVFEFRITLEQTIKRQVAIKLRRGLTACVSIVEQSVSLNPGGLCCVISKELE